MDTVRIMVFYDGNYFKQGNVFFRYSEERGWFSLPELHSLFEKYVASKMKASTDVTKVVAAHYYDGRLTTSVATRDQLVKERDFEMALIKAGIVPHYLPVSEIPNKKREDKEDITYRIAQKGVDVELAIDVLDAAHEDRYDVAILVTGDADFVPLVRRITSLNKHAMIAHFQIDPWKDSRGENHRPTFCASTLIDAASWSLNFNHLVKDSDWKTEVKSLFFSPK